MPDIVIAGATFRQVSQIDIPKESSGTASYIYEEGTKSITQNGTGIDVSGYSAVDVAVQGGSPAIEALSVTQNGTYTAPSGVDGYSPVTVNVSGGGSSNFKLIGELPLGTINTSSTSAADTGKSITVKGVYDYDFLLVECSVDTKINGRHAATVKGILLTAGSAIGTKDGTVFTTQAWNTKLSDDGVATSRAGNTTYGIYPNSCTLSQGDPGDNGQAVIPIYRRANQTSTGVIHNEYTCRVYGVKLYDLIGV